MATYLLGYDIASSSVKAALVYVQTARPVASATSPDQEMTIISPQPGWREQHPEDWWKEVIRAAQRLKENHSILSPVFREAFVNTMGATLDLYNTDGAQCAARGAGIGAIMFSMFEEAFTSLERVGLIEPSPTIQAAHQDAFAQGRSHLKTTELINA
ncbi:FGGY family carbohydrate kinase [Spirosoma flavum]|uniref:FGGY family carbohydrate kinase n=1 Tax=Spirosoma flavum TaxID=2048557 RepID=A0ABW6AKI4_9BACT